MYSRILICGGRSFTDQKLFNEVMNDMFPKFSDRFIIIEGGANGADRMAQLWAKLHGFPHASVHANWHYYGLAAGHKRNGWMLEFLNPDLVIAFPGGRGTRNMIGQALEKGITIRYA